MNVKSHLLIPLAVGLAFSAGLFLGMRHSGTDDTVEPPAPNRGHRAEYVPPSPPTAVPTGSEPGVTAADSKDKEIASLRARIVALEAGRSGIRTREQKLQAARDIYDRMMVSVKSDDRDTFKAMVRRFNELDEETTEFFVEQYRLARGKEYAHVALELALASGGKDCTRFVQELLTSTLYTEAERKELLRYINGVSYNSVPAKLVVDEELYGVALQLSRTDNTWERMGAAGLLGSYGKSDAVIALRQMSESDPDQGVKVAAYRALGRTGDLSNILFLNQAKDHLLDLPPEAAAPANQARGELIKAITKSVEQLRNKIPPELRSED